MILHWEKDRVSGLAGHPPKIQNTSLLPLLKVMGYSCLLDHVELPHVLYLGVLLVNFVGWMGKWNHSKTFLLEHSFMVKS